MLAKIAVAVALFVALINAPIPNPLQDSPATSLAGTPIPPPSEIMPTLAPTPVTMACIKIEYVGNIRTCSEFGPVWVPTMVVGYP